MISREDEERAAWVLFMWSHSLPMDMKQSVVEAIEREERVFIRVPRKKRTPRIPISYSSSESATKEDRSKASVLDGPLTNCPSHPTRNKSKRCIIWPPPTGQKPKKAKRQANGRFEAGASSSSGTREPPPEWLVQLMRVKNGGDPRHIIDKGLTATDVDPHQYRVSMPFSQVKDFEFLTPEEERIIEENARKNRKEGVDVILVTSDLREYTVNLRRWKMGVSPVYALVTKAWNTVVEDCSLKEKDKLFIWSFRANNQLYFAMVPPAPTDSGIPISGRISSALVIKDKTNDGLPHK